DSQSVTMRSEILQNFICWTLNCGVCPEVYLTFDFTVDPPVPQTGAPATLTLPLGNNGECDGAAYLTTVQMAEGLKILSATADYGEITTSNNVVFVYIGRIPARQRLNLTIVMLPTTPGWATNLVQMQSASITPQDQAAFFEVQGDGIPRLGIENSGANEVLLSAWAEPGAPYVLERALLEAPGSSFLWRTVTNFVFGTSVFQMKDAVQTTNSGALYRLRGSQ